MVNVKRSVIRTDKIIGTKVGHIASVVYEDGELENGFVGVLGDLLEGERELRELKLVDDIEKEPLVIISAPELRYEEYLRTDNSLQEFYIKEGKPTRAYQLVEGDIVSIAAEGLTALDDVAGTVVGNYVIAEQGELKLKETASVTGGEAFIGKIIDKDKIGTSFVVGQAGTIGRIIDFTAIEVLKNEPSF